MKRNIALVLTLVFMFAAASPALAAEPKPYIGKIADISMEEFFSRINPGFYNTHMSGIDPLIEGGIIAYQTRMNFAIDNGDQHGFWSHSLSLNEKIEVLFDLCELPELHTAYEWFGSSISVTTPTTADVHVKIENARAELPDGDVITFDAMNGEFSGETDYLMPEHNMADLGLGAHLIDLPDTEILRQGVFKADVTLLQSDSPDMERNLALMYSSGARHQTSDLTREWFAYLKSEGFNSIRFQMTWAHHTHPETHQINRAWLERVEELITLALEEGLYVTVNVNHDMAPTFLMWGFTGDYDAWMNWIKENPEYNKAGWLTLDGDPKVEERFAAIWKQVAEYFKDYNEYVFFESINEPGVRFMDDDGFLLGRIRDQDEAVMKRYMDNLNRLNQIFVDTVRSTGGNNETRFLLTPPFYDGEGSEMPLSYFVLPDDPANRVAVNFSYYYGPTESPFASIKKYLTNNGISAIFTEFGVVDGVYTEQERIAFFRDSIRQANELHMPIMHWGDSRATQEITRWTEHQEASDGTPFHLFPPEIMDIIMGRE